jgi:microcystin-dependent protein
MPVVFDSSDLPIGVVQEFAGALPADFLLCDGSAVSRTTFANLFLVIGTTFGVGNGTTTFNLPNYLGRSAVGVGTYSDSVLGSTTRTLGQSVGRRPILLVSQNFPVTITLALRGQTTFTVNMSRQTPILVVRVFESIIRAITSV